MESFFNADLALLELMVEEGQLRIDREDDVVNGCLLTHEGVLVHEQTAKLLKA